MDLLDLTPLASAAKALLNDLQGQNYIVGDIQILDQVKTALSEEDYHHFGVQLDIVDADWSNTHGDVVVFMVASARRAIGLISEAFTTNALFERGWLITQATASTLVTRISALEEQVAALKEQVAALKEQMAIVQQGQVDMKKNLADIKALLSEHRKRRRDEVDEKVVPSYSFEFPFDTKLPYKISRILLSFVGG